MSVVFWPSVFLALGLLLLIARGLHSLGRS